MLLITYVGNIYTCINCCNSPSIGGQFPSPRSTYCRDRYLDPLFRFATQLTHDSDTEWTKCIIMLSLVFLFTGQTYRNTCYQHVFAINKYRHHHAIELSTKALIIFTLFIRVHRRYRNRFSSPPLCSPNNFIASKLFAQPRRLCQRYHTDFHNPAARSNQSLAELTPAVVVPPMRSPTDHIDFIAHNITTTTLVKPTTTSSFSSPTQPPPATLSAVQLQ